MATFTITGSINIDALTGKQGSDTYNINGGYLIVDQDSRYGLNQSISASLGNVTLSATLGGTVEFNATKVRMIPFVSGSGNVPNSNTTISLGGASAKLLGVYSASFAAPFATGSLMPPSGTIKVKQWNDVPFAAGALAGISATATGPDTPGWIEIVASDALLCTVNRLNTFKVRGEWYPLGTTSGVRSTTYQIPSNGSIVYLPGVWVETDVGTNEYEFYPCAGSQTALLANVATDAIRGKFCWISTTGLLRFGHDGTNSTGGYLPVSGLNIQIPNVFFMCNAPPTFTNNVLPNAALATRYEFATSGGGVLDIDKACINWWMNINQPFSVALSNTGIMTQMLMTECASPLSWSQVGVGQEAANAQFGLSMGLCFAGGTMDKCTWTSATLAASGRYVSTWTDCNGFVVTNERLASLAARGNATTGASTLIRVVDSSWSNCTIGVGRVLMTTCTDVTYTDCIYYDHPATTTATANPMYAFDLSTNCLRIKVDGLTFGGLTMCQPYNGLMNIGAAGCTDIKLRNIGTYTSPLDMGDSRRTDVAWTRVTTTATVISTAHGLKVNDIIYVIVSNDVAAIIVGAKTVASVPTANTFTFTCLNAGAASGILSYYPTMAANLFVLAAGAAANDVEIKRCYTPHTRTNLYTADNSTKNVLIENVMGDYVNIPLTPLLNQEFKGIFSTPSLAAQTSCYGTHWFDCFTGDNSLITQSVGWSRVTTTAFITSSNHLLRTGESVVILSSSATANQAVTLGVKAVTAITGSAFSIPATNSGATTGLLTFAPLSGRVGLLMNESTTETVDQYSIVTGSAAFTSAGGLFMPVVGQKVLFETPNYIVGHTGFALAPPVMGGGTITNYDITYALDKNDGLGYGSGSASGSFHNYYYQRAGGGGSAASTNVTMLSTAGVEVGDYVYGTNIAPNAKVTSITNGTTVVVDTPNIGVVSGILSFTYLPNEININPVLGFKKKIQIAVSASNATAITSLFAYTLNTTGSRAYQYPLDLVPLTITNLRNPSEVRIFEYNTTNEIGGSENIFSGSYTTTIDVSRYPVVDIAILSLGYQNLRYLSQSLGSALTLQAAQIIDRQYQNS
jgi:hypothetical protein